MEEEGVRRVGGGGGCEESQVEEGVRRTKWRRRV